MQGRGREQRGRGEEEKLEALCCTPSAWSMLSPPSAPGTACVLRQCCLGTSFVKRQTTAKQKPKEGVKVKDYVSSTGVGQAGSAVQLDMKRQTPLINQ